MHHNLKIEIERSNTQYVAQIELSTAGTAGRGNVSADSFDGILAKLKEKHDELLGTAQAFHGVGVPHHNITHPSEGQMRQVASIASAPKATADKKGKAKKAKPGKAKAGKPAPKVKDKPRSFASE